VHSWWAAGVENKNPPEPQLFTLAPDREQAAESLRWKVDIHPRNLWVRGSNLTGGHYRLSCPRSADTALKPSLTLPVVHVHSCAAVQNEVRVLFSCQECYVYLLSQKEVLIPFLPFQPVLFCGCALHFSIWCFMPYFVRMSLISFLNGTTNSAISSRTLWTIFWLAKTSNEPIILTTRPAENLNL